MDFACGLAPDELVVFYHPDTLRQIAALRAICSDASAAGARRGPTAGFGWSPSTA